MYAFITSPPLPLAGRPAAAAARSARRCRAPVRAALPDSDGAAGTGPDAQSRPRFARDVDDPAVQPRRSFFAEQAVPAAAPTPNDRVLAKVRATMRELGVEEEGAARPAPRPFRPVDISRVNPLSALGGSVGAVAISAVAWRLLDWIVRFSMAHPLDDQIYVVQRLSVVVRTILVCLFALGSGISGVTALGLLLLAFRTAYAAVTGEFSDKSTSSESST